MTLQLDYPDGATPLEIEELEQLLPDAITTREELNEAEQHNIQAARMWLNRKPPADVLAVAFVFKLHRQMFGKVWRWAGKVRQSGKNIGVDWPQITPSLYELLQNTRYQLQHKVYSLDEIAARFHHALVFVHIFPNGNGRHARLMADLLLQSFGEAAFTWGARTAASPADLETVQRQAYIAALRAADRGDIAPLLRYCRS